MQNKRHRFVRLTALAFLSVPLLALLNGCSSSELPTTTMQIGSRTYQLEIAADEKSREHGLMERDMLPADHGMIFVFAQAQPQSFWMHHTRFPLDIVFADGHQKVVSVATMKAQDDDSTFSEGPAQFAIELNAGEVTACGIKKGDQLHIPPEAAVAMKK